MSKRCGPIDMDDLWSEYPDDDDDDESYNFDDWLADEGWLCRDCGIHTGVTGEYYMVRDELWDEFGCGHGMLCIACLEQRMGRILIPQDFTNAPINNGSLTYRSDRMVSRIGR